MNPDFSKMKAQFLRCQSSLKDLKKMLIHPQFGKTPVPAKVDSLLVQFQTLGEFLPDVDFVQQKKDSMVEERTIRMAEINAQIEEREARERNNLETAIHEAKQKITDEIVAEVKAKDKIVGKGKKTKPA